MKMQIDVNKISRQLLNMDDLTFDRLFQVSKKHIALAKEHASQGTSFERRQAIMDEIQLLRLERDSIQGGNEC